jgi:alpha-beta hydrolase superfamily lysophospholipase
VNASANAVGRYTTLKSFLSQWASVSQADGPANLARTSTPVLFFEHTADASTFPSTAALWLQAGGDRVEAHVLKGGNHYLAAQPHLVKQLADRTEQWCAGL